MMEKKLKDIIDELSPERIIELVTELGSDEYYDKGDYIVFKTICHNIDPADASLKLYYYKKNKKFHCYTDCGDNFDIITLFKRRYELLGEDYNFYKDIVLKITKGQHVFKKKTGFHKRYETIYTRYHQDNAQINLTKLNPSLLNTYTFAATPEWLNDGISEEIMREYNILYSIHQNKIIIPHYDIDDNLIGIRGRALNPEDIAIGKYMPVQIEGKIYSHPLMYNLYGLNKVKENIKRMKIAIVAESEKSPLQYGTMVGMENNICVACCGSSFHRFQFDLLYNLGAERILIAFDKEGETWNEKEKYINKLKSICERYKNKCKMGFIFDTQNLLNLKDSPFDKGLDVFRKLYTKGVWL